MRAMESYWLRMVGGISAAVNGAAEQIAGRAA